MNLTANIQSSFQTTKSTWLTQTGFVVIFGAIISLLILPFSFLIAIAAIDLPTGVDSFLDLGIFFIVSLFALVLVSSTTFAMLIGMMGYFSIRMESGNKLGIEEGVKRPFQNGRLLSYIVLGVISTILYGAIAYLWDLAATQFGWYDLDTSTLMFYLVTIIQILIFLIMVPPFIIASISIANDDTKYNAFTDGWKRLISDFPEVTVTHLASLLPMAIIITGISFTGIAIGNISGSSEQAELTSTLLLALLIIILSFMLGFFTFPYYSNVNAKCYTTLSMEKPLDVKSEEKPMDNTD